MASKATKFKAMTDRQLRNRCFDVLSAGYNRDSKWYTQDCDDLWKGLMAKNRAQLEETLSRWNAINSITEAEMRRNCQFEGLGF